MERRDELLCQTLTAVLSVHFKLQPFAGTRKIPRSFKRQLHLPRRRLVFWRVSFASSHPPRLRGILVNDAIVQEIGGFYEAFFDSDLNSVKLNSSATATGLCHPHQFRRCRPCRQFQEQDRCRSSQARSPCHVRL